MRFTLFSILFLSLISISLGQTLYDENTIQSIKIKFSQSNWDYRLDTAKAGAEGYIMADSVYINGVGFDSVGVKYKGNSSYSANQTKNPWHIELDTYKDQDYQGYKDIKLANIAFDPSFVRETVAYKILKNYMDCPAANYANVYVNGNLIGLYTNTEAINKSFVNEHFGSKSNAFFSCSPPDGAGPQSTNLPNLTYLGTNSSSYTSAYEIKSDSGWNDLINLTNILSTTTSANTANIEAVLDVDRALWMLAFDNLMVNLDSYIGQFKQNYYLYKADNGQFMPIVWDLNMSFGVFGSTGTGGQLTTATKKTLSHTLHSTESAWPLVQKLLGVPTYKKRYLAHYKTILSEMIASGVYLSDATTFQNLILASVTADVNKFSYQTVSNMTANRGTTDITASNNTAPGITGLMSARNTYISGLSDFTNTQPSITNVSPSNANPVLGSTVTIKATVSNTTTSSVYLGYRKSKYNIFVKTQMFDDGAHNDGAAGDNVYGASIVLNNASTQYYIYAENSNVGAFSPARAEYEFYTITATTANNIAAGELAINEIMASNTSTATDPNGEYEDWLELYNNTADTLSLDNLYASDNKADLLKWQFPVGTTIAPYSYLIVWADEDLTETGLHADFKFSTGGESCILSYADGTIVDSTTFGAQTTNMGYARVPNGTGNFVIQAPTFNANNVIDTVVTYPTITPGNLVVNEIMASNATTVTDPSGDYEDWIELYNNTATTLSLDNLYATDDSTNLLKWQFPTGTTIAPYSYLIVWADNELTEPGLHANFKFSASGESCILSYDNGVIVDSVTYGAQTTDMGYARVPNGTGNFVIQSPTYNANNSPLLPSVSITASASTVCSGTSVTFTATPTNGGASPVYQWKKNGSNVGTNSINYSDNLLVNGDVITCVITNVTSATSNSITMTVNATITPSVAISTSTTTINSGTVVTFSAIPTNGGTTPSYQWKKNGNNVGTNSSSYIDSTLMNGDIITCVLTSNITCATTSTVTSNDINMTVNTTTGIKLNNQIAYDVKILPVPANDYVVIQINNLNKEDLDILLYDIAGRLITQTVLYQGSTMSYLDVRTLYNGEYIVKINGKDGFVSKKIIVKHD